MKKAKKSLIIAVIIGVIAIFFVYMSQFRYSCVRKGIWMAEARRTVDTQPGYFIVTQCPGATGAEFEIAYGEHEGEPVELTGNSPSDSLSYIFFYGKTNYCLVHGEERNKENIGIDYYEYTYPVDLEHMYTINVTDWEIIMPIHRDYVYEEKGRYLYPFWCIDSFDVEHRAYTTQP